MFHDYLRFSYFDLSERLKLPYHQKVLLISVLVCSDYGLRRCWWFMKSKKGQGIQCIWSEPGYLHPQSGNFWKRKILPSMQCLLHFLPLEEYGLRVKRHHWWQWCNTGKDFAEVSENKSYPRRSRCANLIWFPRSLKVSACYSSIYCWIEPKVHFVCINNLQPMHRFSTSLPYQDRLAAVRQYSMPTDLHVVSCLHLLRRQKRKKTYSFIKRSDRRPGIVQLSHHLNLEYNVLGKDRRWLAFGGLTTPEKV